ncbi:MAG: hypothetical protein HC897_15780 [Thermoanaerobaculia bacterium]|nr:hypothetical protein [Thermoanaerobaculia bacterium]
MVKTRVSFDPSMYEEAREEAQRLGISFAELCRRAVGVVLRRRPQSTTEEPDAGLPGLAGPTPSLSLDGVGDSRVGAHQALARAQELVRRYVPSGQSLSEELIADRRLPIEITLGR